MNIKINPPRSLRTARLLLRAPVIEDAAVLFAQYTSKPHIPKYMSWVAHTHVDQTIAFVKHCIAGWADGSNFEYVIELEGNVQNPIGMIGMHPKAHGVTLGYVIAEEFWNQGITSEALKALVDWSLAQSGVYRAQAFCDVENPASAKVMEKAGMTYEGTLHRYFVHPNLSDEPRDSLMYAKVR